MENFQKLIQAKFDTIQTIENWNEEFETIDEAEKKITQHCSDDTEYFIKLIYKKY